MSGTHIVGIGLLALGLVCGVASTALVYWYYYSPVPSAKLYLGLWELCVIQATTQEKDCASWNYLDDELGGELDIAWLHACQAMMIIGAVLNLAACGAAIYATMKQMSPRIAQVAAVVAGVCYLIAVAIFGAKYEDSLSDGQTGGHLHAGFGLAVVAGLVNLISTCVLAGAQSGYQRV